jgi:hypothetical protein
LFPFLLFLSPCCDIYWLLVRFVFAGEGGRGKREEAEEKRRGELHGWRCCLDETLSFEKVPLRHSRVVPCLTVKSLRRLDYSRRLLFLDITTIQIPVSHNRKKGLGIHYMLYHRT